MEYDRHMRVNLTGIGALVLVSGTAAAGPFINIDRQDTTSSVGGELTYLFADESPLLGDLTLVRFDLHGQFVDEHSGAGGYATIPIAYGSSDNDSETTVGNVEVGGIYNIPTGTGVNVVLHGGLLLPTASDELGPAVYGGLTGLARIHDYYQWIPKGTTLRLAASPTLTSGKLYARLDAGVDINLDSADEDNEDPAFHINAGIGIWASPKVAITAELSTFTVFDDVEGDDDSLANAAVGARFFAGAVAPYFGFVIPLDDDVNDDIGLGFTVGLDAAL